MPGKVEETAKLIIPGFVGIEFIETCDLIQRWNRASKIGGDAGMGISDQESIVKLFKQSFGHDGGISGLSFRIIGERGAMSTVATIDTVICADSTLPGSQ